MFFHTVEFPNIVSAKGLKSLNFIGGLTEFDSLISADGFENLEFLNNNTDLKNLPPQEKAKIPYFHK